MTTSAAGPLRSGEAAVRPIAHLRWYICALLFFATTINYIDRQILGLLKPVLQRELGWGEAEYGWIVFAFQTSYAIMLFVTGRVVDWLGTRAAYAIAVVVWSLAAMGHALARTALHFSIARFALGIGEAANFPAAIRAVADWFPRRERALAIGLFNSGANIGAVVAPLIVPFLALRYGWQGAFVVTGALGFFWLIAWLAIYRQPLDHPRLSAAELSLIRSDNEPDIHVSIPTRTLLRTRQAWAFLLAKFMTDPVWWFYLYWLPGYLNRTYSLDLTQLGPPLIVVYLSADIGSIGGGWLSSALLKRGMPVNRARKTAMLVCATGVTSAIFIMHTGGNLWACVTLVSIAVASHQGWAANVFSLPSDLFPRQAVGSVTGLGGFAGAVGGMLVAPAVGEWLEWSGSAYGPLFVVAGSMYLIALFTVHLLVPKMTPAKV